MAKREKKDVGKSIWEAAMAKLPAEKQALLKDFAPDESMLEVFGEHGLLRDDYSRLADQAKSEAEKATALYNENLKWRDENTVVMAKGKEALSTLERMRAAGVDMNVSGDGGTTTTTTTQPSTISQEDFNKALRQTELQGISLMTTLTSLVGKHFKEFGDSLDTQEVVAAAQKSGTDVLTAYNNLVAERRETVRKAEFEKEIAKAKKAGYEEGISKASSLPFPGPSGDVVPTTLSGLTKDPAKLNSFGVEAAVREFNQNRSRVTQ